MNYLRLRDNKKGLENSAIVFEEERGSASELIEQKTTFLTDAVRQEIQKLTFVLLR